MPSLSVHLRQPEDHARLPFHPECPICRGERLAGVLPSAAIVSRRAQAAIATGVLALSTSGVPVAVAAEPDQTSAGTTAPEPTGDPAHSPDFDPGGQSTDLPFDAPPTPQVEAPAEPGGEDAPALEQEPATDVDAPVADAGDELEATAGPQPGSSVAQPGPAASPGAPAAAGGTPTPPTAVGDAGASPGDVRGGPILDGDTPRRESVGRGGAGPPVPSDAQTVTPAAASPAATVEPVPAARSTVRVVTGATTGRAVPGDRFHVVLPGESLWSIATDVLGDRATVARVAREVNRLWEVNHDRIVTGDRDLLLVGTCLTLR